MSSFFFPNLPTHVLVKQVFDSINYKMVALRSLYIVVCFLFGVLNLCPERQCSLCQQPNHQNTQNLEIHQFISVNLSLKGNFKQLLLYGSSYEW
jgi:hypothetical protein